MAVSRTIGPSGDVSGVTDKATIAAALALMGAGDELVFNGGNWYLLPTDDNYMIPVGANNQTFTMGSATSKFNLTVVGIGAATTTTGLFNITGKTGITIQGHPANPARLNGGRAVGTAGLAGSACIIVANQAVWGSDNRLVFRNLELVDGPVSSMIIQSAQGGVMSNVKTWATASPVVASHGNDFDAVAADKPTQDWQIVDCDFDSYGNECLKFENCKNMQLTRTVLRNFSTLSQDNADPYSEISGIRFIDCTLIGPMMLNYLKHKGAVGGSLPATTVSLSSASRNLTDNSITATAGVATFVAGDVGKYIAQVGTTGLLGLFLIQTVSSNIVVTGKNIQAWSGTGPFAANAWSFGEVDLTGPGDVTFVRPILQGDGAVIWGTDPYPENYGTITIQDGIETDDDGVVGGGNFLALPSGVTPVKSGTQVGMRSNIIHYIRPIQPPKASAAPSLLLTQATSYASSWAASADFAQALTAGRFSAGDEIVAMDATYWSTGVVGSNDVNNSFTTTGNKSLGTGGTKVTIRAKHRNLAILDGTGVASGQNVFVDTSAPAGSVISDFKIQNWTTGNNAGCNIQTSSAVQVRRMWFHNMATGNGGAGLRSTTTGAAVYDDLKFTSCSCTGATGGGGLYTTSVNASYGRFYFDTCTTSVQMGGAARLDFATVPAIALDHFVAVGCSATGTANGGGIGGKNFTLLHYSANGNTSVAGTPAADLYCAAAGTITLQNSILRSATAVSVAAGTLVYDHNNINGALTGAGAKTNNGGNIDADPLFVSSTNLRLSSLASPSYRTGSFVTSNLDFDSNAPANPPSMGAYEFLRPEAAGGGPGKSSRGKSRLIQVEIDGQVFSARSEAEAMSMLDQVKQHAQAKADLAKERAVKSTRRPMRKVMRDAEKFLGTPAIQAPDLSAYASQVLAEIQGLYQSTLRDIEIEMHLKRAEIEQDDEEVLLLAASL